MFSRNRAGTFCLHGVPIPDLLAQARCKTPAYIYDLDGMRTAAEDMHRAFADASHLVAYAAKANSAGTVIRTLAEAGCGADVVSAGELKLALACGLSPEDILFSGVAKQDHEIDQALSAGARGICAVQVESAEEITRVAARARAIGRTARISLRINPGVVVDTHAHISTGHDAAKFGIAVADLPGALDEVDAHPELSLCGFSSHVGSQLKDVESYLAAARVLYDVARQREERKGGLALVDTGGGFGIDYDNGCPVAPADFIVRVQALQRASGLGHLRAVVEPGRSLVAPFGMLVAQVVQRKHSSSRDRLWLMLDAGMNDLIRPALYQARHRIEPIGAPSAPRANYRVVGPICESSDDFGTFELPELQAGDLVGILDTGAYGFPLASQYNGRSLPAEVFVREGAVVRAKPSLPVERWVDERLAT